MSEKAFEIHHAHRDVTGGWLRPAVFGASDGLVSNFALIAGVTPFPFKVITIASGFTALSLPVFIISAIIARALRFFLVAALLWKFGDPIRDFIERRLGLVFVVFCVLLVGSFFLVGKI